MKKSAAKDTVTSHDLVVMSVLSEEPMHGYKLLQTLRERDVEDWAAMSKPQIYYSLKKLHQKKLIKSKIGVAKKVGSSGPEADVYVLTDDGHKALTNGLSDDNWALQRPPPPFLTWLAMSSHVNHSARKKMIAARAEFLKAELDREEKTLKEFAKANDPMAAAGELMVGLTVNQFKLELSWLDEVMVKLG